MSPERIIHLIAGLIFVAVYLSAKKDRVNPVQILVLCAAAALGSWVSDWDLYIGGIGFHRSPLTHSVAPAFLILLVAHRIQAFRILLGFSLGIASHLLLDTVIYGDVRMIPGGNNDRIFLVVNSFAAIALAIWANSKLLAPELASAHPSSNGFEKVVHVPRIGALNNTMRFRASIKIFIPTFLIIMLVNQSFFGWCMAGYCLMAALPHVTVLSLLATWGVSSLIHKTEK